MQWRRSLLLLAVLTVRQAGLAQTAADPPKEDKAVAEARAKQALQAQIEADAKAALQAKANESITAASLTPAETLQYTDLKTSCTNYADTIDIYLKYGAVKAAQLLKDNVLDSTKDAPVFGLCVVLQNPGKVQDLWMSGLPSRQVIVDAKDTSAKILDAAKELPPPTPVPPASVAPGIKLLTVNPLAAKGAAADDAKNPPDGEANLSRSGAIIWGLTDAAVKLAAKELNDWLIQRVRDEVCSDPKLETTFRTNALIVESCKVLQSTPLLSDIPGGLSTLQLAAQHDLEAVVMRGSEEGYRIVRTKRVALDAAGKTKLDAAVAARDAAVAAQAAAEAAKDPVGAAKQLEIVDKQNALIAQLTADADEWRRKEEALLVLNYVGRVVWLSTQDQNLLVAMRNAPLTGLPKGYEPATARVPTALFQLSFTLQSLLPEDLTKAPKKIEGKDIPFVFGASLVNAQAVAVPRAGWLPPGFDKIPPGLPEMIDATGKQWEAIREKLEEADAARKAKNIELAAKDYAKAFELSALLLQRWVSTLCVKGDGGNEPYACTKLTGSRGWQTLQEVTPLLSSISQGEYGTTLIALGAVFGVKDTTTLPPNARRALAFVVGIAKAKDPNAASAAFQAFMAPPGSYRGKRENLRYYIDLNAYAGFFVAQERVEGQAEMSFAPWVPVGAELGFGARRYTAPVLREIGSVGIFLHAIDVGALASYRVKNGSVDSAPDVGLKEIFSPGAFLVLGLKNAPLTIGAGVSFTPELRKITSDGGKESSANSVRYGLTVALDLPIFP